MIDTQLLRRAVINNARKKKKSIMKYLQDRDIPENIYYAHIGEVNKARKYKYLEAYLKIIDIYNNDREKTLDI